METFILNYEVCGGGLSVFSLSLIFFIRNKHKNDKIKNNTATEIDIISFILIESASASSGNTFGLNCVGWVEINCVGLRPGELFDWAGNSENEGLFLAPGFSFVFSTVSQKFFFFEGS